MVSGHTTSTAGNLRSWGFCRFPAVGKTLSASKSASIRITESEAMDAMQLLHTRYSALRLGEPAPSPEAVRAILDSAARVPDHGRLLPWRLVLVEGDARLSLGDVLAESLSRRNPLANE